MAFKFKLNRTKDPKAPKPVFESMEAEEIYAKPKSERLTQFLRFVDCLILAVVTLVVVSASLANCLSANALLVCPAAGIAAVLLTAGLAVVLRKEQLTILIPAVGLGLCVLSVAVLPEVRMNFVLMINTILGAFNQTFSTYVPLLGKVLGQPSSPLFAAVLGVFTGLGAWLIAQYDRTLLLLGSLAVTSCFLLALGLGLGWVVAAALCLGMFGSFSVRVTGHRQMSALPGFALGVIVLAFGSTLFFTMSFTGSPQVDAARAGLVAAVDQVRYGSDTLPQGQLANAAGMNQGKDSRLEVSTAGSMPDKLYLKGFSGHTYANSAWAPLDYQAYEGEWKGLHEWLAKRGFDEATQYGAFVQLKNDSATTSDVQVKVTGADRRYVYAPYSLHGLMQDAVSTTREGVLLSDRPLGSRDYAFDYLPASDPLQESSELKKYTDAARSFKDAESVYRSYVHEHYLDVDEKTRAFITQKFYGDETWSADDTSLNTVVSRVRIMLNSMASYSDKLDMSSSSGDAMQWFLSDGRKGNSAFFATAAVLALRVQGIPARYAEGYLLERDTLDGAGAATLTAKDAHAWAEVYRDNMGWVPVEFTPGFYQENVSVGKVVPVTQKQGAGNDGNVSTDAVAGSVNESGQEEPEQAGPSPLVVLLALVVLVLLALGAVELRRALVLGKRRRDCESDDQAVAIAACCDAIQAAVQTAGIPFDKARPFAHAEQIAEAFEGFAPDEVTRGLQLIQKYYFGQKDLRPHEMRTVRRVTELLEINVPETKGVRNTAKRRWKYML